MHEENLLLVHAISESLLKALQLIQEQFTLL